MEKETRTSKYKDYREAAKEGEDITVKQEEDGDDDFLSFIPHGEDTADEEEELHPLSYDTLKDDDTVVQALKSVKAKNDYDTKMDILNRIKADTLENSPGVENSKAPKTEEDVEAFKKKSEPASKPVKPVEEVKPEVKKAASVTEKKAEATTENLNDIDLSSVSKKSVTFANEEPVKLSRKEIKALKKQEKDEKKREKIEEKKESEKLKKAEVKPKPEPKPEVKVHNPRMEAKTAEKSAAPVKKKPSVFSRILDFIVLILLIIVLIFIVITIMSII